MQRSIYAKALRIHDMVPGPDYGYIWYRRRDQAEATNSFVDLGEQPVVVSASVFLNNCLGERVLTHDL